MTIVVNVSDAKASANPEDVLATYSLGSCIGVALFDPVVKVAGLLHYQLPSSSMDPERARQVPAMFADTGLDLLLREMEQLGGQKKRMKLRVAGAAQMLTDASLFNIGRRNHAAIRKLAWQHGMFIEAEDVGGTAPRSLYVHVADGRTVLRVRGEEKVL